MGEISCRADLMSCLGAMGYILESRADSISEYVQSKLTLAQRSGVSLGDSYCHVANMFRRSIISLHA